MIGTAGAIIASAVIGGGISLLAGKMNADAAADKNKVIKDASDAGTKAILDSNEKVIAESRRQFEENQKALAPWREAGEAALGSIKKGIADGSFSMDNFEFKKDEGYDFRLGEGTKALERSAAARGNLFSGATGKAINSYAQEFASDEYDRAFARAANEKATSYNILADQAGIGRMATKDAVDAGNLNSQNIISALTNNGQAIYRGQMAGAMGYESGGPAWGNAFMNAGGALNTGIENYLLYNAIG